VAITVLSILRVLQLNQSVADAQEVGLYIFVATNPVEVTAVIGQFTLPVVITGNT
jgi:hypothetical protein